MAPSPLHGARKRFFASLANRNYRRFWVGNSFSLIGTWMQQTAQGWLVFRLTGSAQMLGLVGFLSQVPLLAFGLFAGVLADRWDRRRALILTQVVAMFQAALLGALVLGEWVRPWHVAALALVLGMVNTFDIPLRHAFLIDLVGSRRVGNAVALNSIMFNVTRMVGPALAGVLVALAGEGICFILNALSFGGIILVLSKMKPREVVSSAQEAEPVLESLKEGIVFVWSRGYLRNLIIMLVLCGMVITPVLVLLPAVAERLLHGGPRTLGLLFSCLGCGSLVGAVLMAMRRSERLLHSIAWAAGLYGAALLTVALSGTLAVSCLAALAAGFGAITVAVGTNTQLQSSATGRLRGRLASLYMLAYFGLAPLGNLLLGRMGDRFGIAAAFGFAGAWTLLAAGWFAGHVKDMESERRLAAPYGALVELD